MQVSYSIESLHKKHKECAAAIKNEYESQISDWCKKYKFHFYCRVKSVESFAQKMETTRGNRPDDVFAGTIVVKNRNEVKLAVDELKDKNPFNWRLIKKIPENFSKVNYSPAYFNFDSVRLYFIVDDPYFKDPIFKDEIFEIQIRTLLDDAWGQAGHDFFYKTDEKLSWAKERLMYQIKALLENAEVALTEAEEISNLSILQIENRDINYLNDIMEFYIRTWNKSALPKDMRRLSDNTKNLLYYLKKDFNFCDLETLIQLETKAGRGAKIINLSPYWIVVQSIAQKLGWEVFCERINLSLSQKRKSDLSFPLISELNLPDSLDFSKYAHIKIIGNC